MASIEEHIPITGITIGEFYFLFCQLISVITSWIRCRWMPFDTARNWPDLGPRFEDVERIGRMQAESPPDRASEIITTETTNATESRKFVWDDRVSDDKRDLDWATVLKRTFESYIRGERPNMYGEWMRW